MRMEPAAAERAERLAREERAERLAHEERVAQREERAAERAATTRAEKLAREERAAAAEAARKLYELLAASLGSVLAQRLPPPLSKSASPAQSGSPGAAGALAGGAGGGGGGGGASASGGRSPADAGGGRSPHGSGSNSPLGRTAPAGAQEALQAAFAAAAAAPDAPPLAALPALPCPASALLPAGLAFAHRLCGTFGSVATSFLDPADFAIVMNAEGVPIIQPASADKPGMSFFLVTRETSAVLRAAHSFRGAAQNGCQAFPLRALPDTLSLVVDRVQLADAQGTPVLLHASLAPTQPMDSNAFLAELRQWRGVLPCDMKGAAGAQDCLREHGGEEARFGSTSCRGARALVGAAAAKLAAQAHPAAAAQPACGSPGAPA